MTLSVFSAETLALIEEVVYPNAIVGGVLAYESERKYLHVAGVSDSSIGVIDMNDPDNPVVLGALIATPYTASITAMMATWEGVVIASSSSNSISLVSSHDPSNPVIVATITASAFANVAGLVQMKSGVAFAACNTDTSIKGIATTGVYSSLQDTTKFAGMIGLERSGLYLVTIGTTNDYLTIIDASDANNLRIVGSIQDSALGAATSFKIDGDYVGVATSAGTIIVVSIRDLSAPAILHTYTNAPLIGTAPELLVIGGLYYVVNGVAGLITVFDFRTDAAVNFDYYGNLDEAYRFGFDGLYHTDSRICLDFYGPGKLLALSYEVDDTDNPAADG